MKNLALISCCLVQATCLSGQVQSFQKIGIGTTPSYPLHIFEHVGQTNSVIIDAAANANPNIYFWASGQPVANLRYADNGNDHFQLQTGDPLVSAIDISMDGKVGVGNITPQHTLEVNGDLYVHNVLKGKTFTIDLNGGDPTTPKRITSGQVGQGATMELQTYNHALSRLQTRLLIRGNLGNDIELYDKDGNQFVHFDGDNGKVGIGTITPNAKLSVNGSIVATEVKVKTDVTVPDYVFEDDYKLLSLPELEKYIQKYKHLPEVPSAAEIQEKGLDLAAMNLLLLKKIEELTLLLIEQDKQIQALIKAN